MDGKFSLLFEMLEEDHIRHLLEGLPVLDNVNKTESGDSALNTYKEAQKGQDIGYISYAKDAQEDQNGGSTGHAKDDGR